MKRPRATRCDAIVFSVAGLPETTFATVRRTGMVEGEIDDLSTDSADYVLFFRPPLTKERAKKVHVKATYQGRVRVRTTELFGQYVWPEERNETRLVFRKYELEYACFGTHQVRVETEQLGDEIVCAMYLRFINATVAVDPRYDLYIRLDAASNELPVRTLPWFPPDLDPGHWGLRIDSRAIPQRTALWFKLRGENSGSKAYKLLGFFADSKKGTFKNTAMRLGTLSEGEAALMYSVRFPELELHEVGWCPMEGRPGWGASPDMLALDPATQTWSVLEIKTSATKLSMEAYFYPQLYMEMMAAQARTAQVLRFCPRRYEPDIVEDEMNIYTVQRDESIEKMLLELWVYALAHEQDPNLYSRSEFQSARTRFIDLARAQTQAPNHQLQASSKYRAALQAYRADMERVLRVVPAPEDVAFETVRDELYDQSLEFTRAVKKGADRELLARMLADQMVRLARH